MQLKSCGCVVDGGKLDDGATEVITQFASSYLPRPLIT